MSLPPLKLSTSPNRPSVEVLPALILHWKLVELLFEEGKVERACQTLIKWAATHRGATQDIQYAMDGGELTCLLASLLVRICDQKSKMIFEFCFSCQEWG